MRINREGYLKVAFACYKNSVELFEEAQILAGHSRFARAYALCVLSSEEFAKSFLWRGVSAGIAREDVVRRVARKHEEKLLRFIHLLVEPIIESTHPEISKAREHDVTEPDHSKHIYPAVMDKVNEKVQSDLTPFWQAFYHAHRRKTRAFYVDIIDDKLAIPNTVVGKQFFDEIHEFLSRWLDGFDVILKEDDETFRKLAEHIDPGFRFVLGPTVALAEDQRPS